MVDWILRVCEVNCFLHTSKIDPTSYRDWESLGDVRIDVNVQVSTCTVVSVKHTTTRRVVSFNFNLKEIKTMDNDTKVVDTVTQDATQAVEDTSHLIVEITQDTYDKIQELREVAEGRGLNSDFMFWFESMATKHAKVQLDLWRKADDAQIFNRAQKGSSQAKLAILTSLYGKEIAQKMLAALPVKK